MDRLISKLKKKKWSWGLCLNSIEALEQFGKTWLIESSEAWTRYIIIYLGL